MFDLSKCDGTLDVRVVFPNTYVYHMIYFSVFFVPVVYVFMTFIVC
jgi:hypothetical protein